MRSVADSRPSLPPEWTKDRLIAMLQGEADAAIAFMERGVRVRIDRGVRRGANIKRRVQIACEAHQKAEAAR